MAVVDHIMGHYWRQGITLECKHTSLEEDALGGRQQRVEVDDIVVLEGLALGQLAAAVHESITDLLLDISYGVLESFDDGLALEGLDGIRAGSGRHDDERDDGFVGARDLEAVVEPGQRLDEHVGTLVAELVAAADKEVQGVVEVPVKVAVKVPLDELADSGLVDGVQVLELVHGAELDDIEAVGHHAVGLALEEVLRLVGGDMTDGCEDVARVSGRPLDTVAMVDTPLAGLGVDVEILEVVVEVHVACAQVAAQQGGMGGEDGGEVHLPLANQGDRNTGEPLVEMGNHGVLLVSGHKLSQKPCYKIAKHNCIISLGIVGRGRNVGRAPQVGLPLVEVAVRTADIEQHHSGGSINQPAAVHIVDASLAHAPESVPKHSHRFERLNLHISRLVVELADHNVAAAILFGGDGGLCFEYRVDTADPIRYLGCDFEQQVILDVSHDGVFRKLSVVGAFVCNPAPDAALLHDDVTGDSSRLANLAGPQSRPPRIQELGDRRGRGALEPRAGRARGRLCCLGSGAAGPCAQLGRNPAFSRKPTQRVPEYTETELIT